MIDNSDVKLEPVVDEEMFCFVAPDGFAQMGTLAPDFATCIAMVEFMASVGMSKPAGQLFLEGFTILPVLVTLKQNGTAEQGFARAKETFIKNAATPPL